MSGELALNDIALAFGGVLALEQVSFSARPGEIIGVIGPNGAGKTSLLNVICGLQVPQSGSVRLDGAELVGCSASAIARAGIARTFQTSQIFSDLTVLENVMCGLYTESRVGLVSAMFRGRGKRKEERDFAGRAREMLAFFGIEGLAGRPGGALSFGQQRIVELARALIREPKLLLLDEPAVGLSPPRVAALDSLLRRIRDERGVTLLMIEHVIRLIMDVSDRVIVLNSGRKIAEGTPSAVQRDQRVVEAYLGKASHAQG